MTIQVTSNADPVVQAEKPAQEGEAAPSVLAGDKPAEQETPAKSDTAEPEAKDEKDEEDDTEEEGTEPEAAASEDGKPRKKIGAQRRKERAERAEAEVTRLRGIVEEMARKGAGEPKTEPKTETPASTAPAGKPDPEKFETHAEYVEALTDWKIEEREKAAKAKAEKADLETEQEKRLRAFGERRMSFAEKTKDFDDVLAEVDDVRVSPTIENLIILSESGPELMYELAKNRAEYERINKLPPLDAAREFGKLEFKLASKATEPKPETKTITKAPKPITPVGGKGGAVEKTIYDAANLSQREFEAAVRRRQDAARKTAW